MRHELVCFGELLWDVYNKERKIGGALFNVAAISSIIDVESVMITAVGNKQSGKELLELANQTGVHTICQINNKPTGKVNVTLDRRKKPTFKIAKDSAYDYIKFDEEISTVATHAKVFCFGTLAQRNKQSRETLRKLLDNTAARVIYDVNFRPGIKNWKQIFEESLVYTDVLKCDRDELNQLIKEYKWKEDEREFLYYLIKKHHLTYVFVTDDEHGASLYTVDKHCLHSKIPKADVVDTTGCGDAFTAAIVSGILNNFSDKSILEYATKLASKVAEYKGAVPDKLI